MKSLITGNLSSAAVLGNSMMKQVNLFTFLPKSKRISTGKIQVRQAVKEVISFWAEKEMDGFRLDVINLISKQDFPSDDLGDGRRFSDGPRVHEYLKSVKRCFVNGGVTVGEMSSTSGKNTASASLRLIIKLSMVFNFHHLKVIIRMEKNGPAPFACSAQRDFNHWQTGLVARLEHYFGVTMTNHELSVVSVMIKYRVESFCWAHRFI